MEEKESSMLDLIPWVEGRIEKGEIKTLASIDFVSRNISLCVRECVYLLFFSKICCKY